MTLEQTGVLIIVASFVLAIALAWRGAAKEENDTNRHADRHRQLS